MTFCCTAWSRARPMRAELRLERARADAPRPPPSPAPPPPRYTLKGTAAAARRPPLRGRTPLPPHTLPCCCFPASLIVDRHSSSPSPWLVRAISLQAAGGERWGLRSGGGEGSTGATARVGASGAAAGGKRRGRCACVCASPHIALQEAAVKVVADGVVDEAALRLWLPARLVAEHNVVVPPPLDRKRGVPAGGQLLLCTRVGECCVGGGERGGGERAAGGWC